MNLDNFFRKLILVTTLILITVFLFAITACGNMGALEEEQVFGDPGLLDTYLEQYPFLKNGTVRSNGVEEIEEAVKSWNEALEGEFLVLIDQDSPSDADIEIFGGYVPPPELPNRVGVARATDTGCLIEINTDRLEANEIGPHRTLVHELGHCLGLSHSSSPESLMYFKIFRDNQDLLDSDISRVQVRYGI